MKQLYTLILCVFPVVSFAQSLSFSKTHYGVFIGLENQVNPAAGGPSSPANLNGPINQKEYFLPNNTIILLEQSMNKAIEWSHLNAVHKMVFQKEITRFKVMRKDQMIKYREFIPQYAFEANVFFDGKANGQFICTLTFESGSSIEFHNERSISNFIDLLNSKLTNATVDNVFH